MSTIALLCLLSAPPADVSEDSADDVTEKWSVISIEGSPVGYDFSRTRTGDDGTVAENISLLNLKRFGQTFEMKMSTTVRDDAKGRLTAFRLEQKSPGQPAQVTSGRVEGDDLVITAPSAGGSSSRSVGLPADVFSPLEIQKILETNPPGPGETRTLKTFAIETAKVITTTIKGLGPRQTTDLGGNPQTLRAVEISRSDMPIKTINFLDRDGEIVRTDLGLMNMVAFASDRETALKAAGGSEYDFGLGSLVKVERSPGLEAKRSARYEVVGSALPSMPGVQAVMSRGDTQIVTVTAPEDVAAAGGDVGPEYLASTRWVDWKSPEVTAIAAKLDEDAPAAERAATAEQLVDDVIDLSSYGVGFATAGEAARSHEGDCTEHGVLLCGVLRAAGIPARTAYGLVYVDSASAMVPHMWTEAHVDGRWIPLDATRPGRPDAGYLKFGDSALASDGQLPDTGLADLTAGLNGLKVRVLEASDTNLAPAK